MTQNEILYSAVIHKRPNLLQSIFNFCIIVLTPTKISQSKKKGIYGNRKLEELHIFQKKIVNTVQLFFVINFVY